MSDRLLDDAGLRAKGIKFSRQHRHKLIRDGKFPPPLKAGENTNAWVESEIDAWIQQRITERDSEDTVA
jgi:predicted DNA-binding transcriptional regulator AlpA